MRSVLTKDGWQINVIGAQGANGRIVVMEVSACRIVMSISDARALADDLQREADVAEEERS